MQMMKNEMVIISVVVLPNMLVARMTTISGCVVIGIGCVVVVAASLVVGAGACGLPAQTYNTLVELPNPFKLTV